MSVIESGIRSDFLNPANYKATLDFCSKRNDSFMRYCRIIQKYYCDLQAMTKVMKDKAKPNEGSVLRTCTQFRHFLMEFMGIIDEVSTFKIQYYEELEQIEEDPVKKPTYDMLAKVAQYSETQNTYKEVHASLQKVDKKIEEAFFSLRKETKDPVNYFDAK